ncbi:MAG: substrate-binding domain-containing protein [Akkermansiaceae bacterium]
MKTHFISVAEQVAQAIREGLEEGRWKNTVPGRNRLAAELGVNHKTVQRALNQLEGEGLLKSRGPGRDRLIVGRGQSAPKALRVTILAYGKSDFITANLLRIIHRLQEAGHIASFANKTLTGMGMDAKRVAQFAKKTEADAWVVVAGSFEVMEWFASQKTPAFALYGRASTFPLASIAPKKANVLVELIDRLVDLGHRSIVMVTQEGRRKPDPGFFEKLFLECLEQRGIPTSSYNLPDWGNSPEELHKMLNSLFEYTPPTALIVDEPSICVGFLQSLSRLGITAPDDVSLACMDQSELLDWCEPSITHISWDPKSIVNRVVKWADNVSHGKEDRRKSTSKSKLVLGGTIGPARKVTG